MSREFIIGETYGCRSACDWDTMFTWEVVARTAKFITVRERGERDRRVKVYIIDGVERAIMGILLSFKTKRATGEASKKF